MNSIQKIDIGEFTHAPFGRYREDGPKSGEEFRENWLEPAVKKAIAEGVILEIVIDDVEGYGDSFIESVFGGAVRDEILPNDIEQIKKIIRITYPNKPYFEMYKDFIWEHISNAIKNFKQKRQQTH